MKYFELTYPNHTVIILKHKHDIEHILNALTWIDGIRGVTGTVYNPKGFLTLKEIDEPDDHQKLVAQDFMQAKIG